MAGEGVFPKADGDILYASEVNQFQAATNNSGITIASVEGISGLNLGTYGSFGSKTDYFPDTGSTFVRGDSDFSHSGLYYTWESCQPSAPFSLLSTATAMHAESWTVLRPTFNRTRTTYTATGSTEWAITAGNVSGPTSDRSTLQINNGLSGGGANLAVWNPGSIWWTKSTVSLSVQHTDPDMTSTVFIQATSGNPTTWMMLGSVYLSNSASISSITKTLAFAGGSVQSVQLRAIGSNSGTLNNVNDIRNKINGIVLWDA